MKLLTVIGARPQFIKATLVSKKLRSYSQQEEILVHTGQHYDYNISEQFFQEMEIPKPDYNLFRERGITPATATDSDFN